MTRSYKLMRAAEMVLSPISASLKEASIVN